MPDNKALTCENLPADEEWDMGIDWMLSDILTPIIYTHGCESDTPPTSACKDR